ncbi:MAG: multicopper oxidase domain-containing protein, partial [Steroidobacteraceae bacterium]
MTTSNNSLPRSLAVALALIFGSSAVQAAQVQVWLEAREFTPTSGVLMNVPMWGYSLCSANFASCDPATSPGPVITVPAGDGLTIYLSNALADPTSIQLVGQRNAPLPVNADPLRVNGRLQALAAEVGPGSTDSYSWAAGDLRSGTILYQSASHVQLQVQMGLYGAVEHDAAVAYDSSRLMVFSEVDAALHSPPSPANLTPDGYRPRVLLINGEPLANSVLPAISAGPNERVLLRMVNAGLANHAPELIGGRFEIVAEDGYPVPARHSQTATLLPAAKTIDALLVAPAAGGTFGMFDRMARVGSIPTPPPPPDVDPPTAPGTPAFSLVTASTATASWTAATDLVGVTAYDFSLDGINWTVVGNFLSVDLTGLTPSTLYTFYVRARDLAGNMGPASSDTFTTDVAPPDAEPPSSPGTPGFTNVTTSTATASWAAATDNMAVTAYDYSLDNVNWTALGNVLTVDLTGL